LEAMNSAVIYEVKSHNVTVEFTPDFNQAASVFSQLQATAPYNKSLHKIDTSNGVKTRLNLS